MRRFSEQEKRNFVSQFQSLVKQGMIRDDAAKQIGINRTSVSNWEREYASESIPPQKRKPGPKKGSHRLKKKTEQTFEKQLALSSEKVKSVTFNMNQKMAHELLVQAHLLIDIAFNLLQKD